jgi:membrane-bound lytic murein transglycosylase D
MRRSGKKTFWEIYPYLPRETRSYVPQFVAIVYSFKYAEEHNLIIDEREYEYAMASDTIMVKQFTNLATVANLLDLCNEDLELLNPAIKRKAIPDSKRFFTLRLPADKMEYFQLNRESILDSASTGKQELDQIAKTAVGGTYGRDKVIHRVNSGDVLGAIAQQYKVSVADIKKWNNLYSNTIRVGQKLDIWLVPGSYNSSATLAKVTVPQNVVVNGTKYHVVQPGDTLWLISKTYNNVSVEQIKQWNNLKTNAIKPGQKLVVGYVYRTQPIFCLKTRCYFTI